MLESVMTSGLKFLTLNCWGIPFITPQKNRRMKAILETIRKGHWDVVALQEVWLKSDQELFIKNSGFEHSIVFNEKNRLFGSGLVLLSRFKILDHDFHSFRVRGFPHRVYEGDFHSTKGVGYALLQSPIGDVPVFLTHLISKYTRRHEHDTNRVFRIAQILELLFYIRRMASPKGFVLCGDLNAGEHDLEIDALYSLVGHPRRARPALRNRKMNVDHIICGASHQKLEFKIIRMHLTFLQPNTHAETLYSDHAAIEAAIRAVHEDVDSASAKRSLDRTYRYMTYSMEIVKNIDRRIRWIPVIGWIIGIYMKPQLAFINILLEILEMDLKQTEPGHPLRLGSHTTKLR